MFRFAAPGRALAGSALALPLTLALIGSGGGLLLDPETPWARLGSPGWLLAAWGLAELGLAVATWVPVLHRAVGAIILGDAAVQAWAYAAAGRTPYVVMYLVMTAMGAALALLSTSEPVASPRAAARPRARGGVRAA